MRDAVYLRRCIDFCKQGHKYEGLMNQEQKAPHAQLLSLLGRRASTRVRLVHAQLKEVQQSSHGLTVT